MMRIAMLQGKILTIVLFLLTLASTEARSIRGSKSEQRDLTAGSSITRATSTPCSPYFAVVDIHSQTIAGSLCDGDTIHLSQFTDGITIQLDAMATKYFFDRTKFFVNGTKVGDRYGDYSLMGGYPKYNKWNCSTGKSYQIEAVLMRGFRLVHASFNVTLNVAD